MGSLTLSDGAGTAEAPKNICYRRQFGKHKLAGSLTPSDPEPTSRPSCLLSVSAETQHQSGKESRSFDHVIGDTSRVPSSSFPAYTADPVTRAASAAPRRQQLDGISRSRLAKSSDLTGLSKRKAVSSLRSTSRRPARLRRRSVCRRSVFRRAAPVTSSSLRSSAQRAWQPCQIIL
jgi:hypothetical protein